jgi:hypothetical protein
MASKALILSEGDLQLAIEHTSASKITLVLSGKVSFAVGGNGLFFVALTGIGR